MQHAYKHFIFASQIPNKSHIYYDQYLHATQSIKYKTINKQKKNAIMHKMYVSGATLFEGVKDIEGSDWADTQLCKDQQKYLCNHPTAKGTNPVTGVDTRESLMFFG